MVCYDIQKGQILIDGIDVKHIKIASLRRHFVQMLQDVFLFSGTIRSNIVLREESFTDEQIWEDCHYVNADHFINKLDETAANIDTETELLIQDSLERMKDIGAILIVAHRPSTIQHADIIITLYHSVIKEQGHHQELLRQKGRYYRLYTLQYEVQKTQTP